MIPHRPLPAALAAFTLLGLAASCAVPVAEPTPRARPSLARPPAAPQQPIVAPVATAPRPISVRQRVRTETLSGLTFDDQPYGEVFKLIRTVSAVPIVVTPGARDVIDSEGLTLDMEISARLSVENLLNLMVGRSEDLAWTVRYDVVLVTTKSDAAGGLAMCTYDVRDLIFARTEFYPPIIRGIPTGEDSETPVTGGEAEDKVTFVEPDQLIATIKDATDPEYWDREGGGTIDYSDGGYLIVTASPEMHRRIGRCLGM